MKVIYYSFSIIYFNFIPLPFILFTKKLIMEDIEKKHICDYSTVEPIINNKFDKDLLFYILATCGLLLYVGTNLYISSVADYKLFVWHPILMAFMILISTHGKKNFFLTLRACCGKNFLIHFLFS